MLCEFSGQFPVAVEHFLERGRRLRRRFREETITDLLMASLSAVAPGRLIVDFPDEPAAGAAMEWNFVNPDDSTFFRILLQAKQAYGDGRIWTRHSYRDLYQGNQAANLCDAARAAEAATHPLYIFYHPSYTRSLARRQGATIAGANLADGYLIEHLVRTATTRTLRTSHKSLGTIAQHLFPLAALFCPDTIIPTSPFALASEAITIPLYPGMENGRVVLGVAIPPTPMEIQERLLQNANLSLFRSAPLDGPPVPPVATRIPPDVQAILERRRSWRDDDETEMEPLDRWRLTFISSSPPEDPRKMFDDR